MLRHATSSSYVCILHSEIYRLTNTLLQALFLVFVIVDTKEEPGLLQALKFREVALTALPDIHHTTLCAGEGRGRAICQCWPKLQIARPSIDKGYLIALLWYRHQPDSSLESEWTVFTRRDDTGTLQHGSVGHYTNTRLWIAPPPW